MTVTASACSAENREQLQAVQERPSAVDAGPGVDMTWCALIVAPCVEPHRTDRGRPDIRRSERAGWLVTQKRCTPETASSFEETAGFHRHGETVQQDLVCRSRRLQQLRQVTGHWIKLSDKQTVDKAAGGPV